MSVAPSSLLVSLVETLEAHKGLFCSAPRTQRGRPRLYEDSLFLKALVIMVVRRLTTPNELWHVLHQPTPEMVALRTLLTCGGRFPCRRTWERRLALLPDTLPAQIAVLGRFLVEKMAPFAHSGRAVALDSTLLRAFGGFVWHKKEKEQGVLPHSGIDTQAGWTKSGHHGWVYGWKLHRAVSCGAVWIPLAAELTPANCADNVIAVPLVDELPLEVRFVLGDTHYNAPNVRVRCELGGQTLIASGHGAYPHPDNALHSKAVRSFFHKLRSCTIENFNQQFKTLFDAHRPVPTKGLSHTQNWALGAVLSYQLLLFHRHKHNLPLRTGLKHALKAT
ncbi:hypothetical protein IAD21_05437 [Abditibacteriota bacterium]|nr:hypothetical protein IAD21_00302 [Abditibacteriota bacterium]BCM93546.1 hypothetical protein IAD21_05437 [Abditibacteriota bacterium]